MPFQLRCCDGRHLTCMQATLRPRIGCRKLSRQRPKRCVDVRNMANRRGDEDSGWGATLMGIQTLERGFKRVQDALASPIASAMNVGASILLVGIYVYDTYVPVSEASNFVEMTETALCFGFLLDYCNRIARAPGERLRVAFSLEGVVDLATFLPVVVTVVGTTLAPILNLPPPDSAMQFRFVRLFRVLRVLRIGILLPYLQSLGFPGLTSERSEANTQTAVNLRIYSLISSVTVLLLVTASIVQLVEGLTFGNALYFTLLTLSTVGFGDITPQTALGKASTAALIIIGAIVIPVQISQLNSYLGERKTVVGDPTPLRGTLHVMVHAKLNDFSGFKDFYDEFFSEVRQLPFETKLVFISESRPDFEYRAFSEVNEKNVAFVEGSILEPNDLERAQAMLSQAWLLLTDRYSNDPHAEDQQQLLRVLSLKNQSTKIPLFVQVLRPETKRDVMPFLSPARDVCVSLYELKQQLMGLNLLAPGASTLIGNILRSVVPPDVEDESLLTEWPGDYVRGCSYEMFFSPSLRIGSQLSGFRFSELAECLYRDAGIILIGLFGTALQDFGASGVAVNPGSHSLTGDEVAIVLARSSEQAVQALRRAPEKITSVQISHRAAAMSNVGRHTSLAQSNEHLSFVLMGELEQTRYMLRSLEASRLVTEKPEITLMAMEGSDNPQSLLQWDELSREVQSPVHIVKGSESMFDNMSDVTTSAENRAVAVLAEGETPGEEFSKTEVDTRSIFGLYGALKSQTSTHVCAEFAYSSSTEYVQPGLAKETMKPADRFGVDASITRRLKKRPRSAKMPKQMLSAGEDDLNALYANGSNRSGISSWQLHPLYASGQMFLPGLVDTFASQGGLLAVNPRVLEEVLAQLSWGIQRARENQNDRLGGRLLFVRTLDEVVDETEAVVGLSFEKFFLRVLRKGGEIPIGLSRVVDGYEGLDYPQRDYPLRYVVTCPLASTTIAATDKVFVLAPSTAQLTSTRSHM